jgi:uncharacterized protein (TIGR00299 family) protein
MLLGALLDLGLPLEALRAELAKLPLPGWRLEAGPVQRSGLKATKAEVVVEGGPHRHHRGLDDILGIIASSALAVPIKEKAAALFRRLGEAEAAVHGTTPDRVHFHEVGAVDAIVDIVGGVIGVDWLGVEKVVASPLNLGSGTVTMEHGTFPIPAPATALLVRGVPVFAAGDGERLTPTGAVLVTGHADDYGPLPAMVPRAVGYGAGSRDTPDRPNVLRLVVGEESPAHAGQTVLVLETEIDDMPPQLLAPLLEKLLAHGALDVYYTPVQMKKGRPGVLVTALCAPERRPAVEDLLFAETTTLGVRWQEWQRTVLERRVARVGTPYGEIGVKLGLRGGAISNVSPEFEDCRRAAEQAGVPVKEVWAAALAAWRAREPVG